MTYRELILKLLEFAPSLDNEAHVALWERTEDGKISSQILRYPIEQYNMVHDDIIVELRKESK